MEKWSCRTFMMNLLVLLALKRAVGQNASTKTNDHYCSISRLHTMCRYTQFDSLKLRCSSYKPIPAVDLKQFILQKHNSLRNSYASHNLTNFTVPNMLALEWDNELADIATRWAWQCPLQPDEFRNVDRFKVANLVGSSSSRTDKYPSLDQVWESLLRGNKTFHKSRITRGKETLISAFTEKEPLSLLTNPYFQYVGCAAAHYIQLVTNFNERRTTIVCNYGPLDAPYAVNQPTGPPCAQCPSAMACIMEPYRHLCFENFFAHNHSGEFWGEYSFSGPEINRTDDQYGEDYVTVLNRTQDYCNIICGNGQKHTLCEYEGPTDDYDEVIPIMSQDMQMMILNAHNIVRDNYAAGRWEGNTGGMPKQTSTELPLAANMREMQWNEELEAIALMWTMQCKDESDSCRDSYLSGNKDVPTYVSQLMQTHNWTGQQEFPSPENSFFEWFGEHIYFSEDKISPFKKPDNPARDYSSFAQIIWADSYMLGCAMTLCRNFNSTFSFVITACNYGPGGMIEGRNVYFRGGPCTHCSRLNFSSLGGMYCSLEYVHLCSGADSFFTRFTSISFFYLFVLTAVLHSRRKTH